MSAITSCFIKPEDNIARSLLVAMDIAFETPFDVFQEDAFHSNGWEQYC